MTFAPITSPSARRHQGQEPGRRLQLHLIEQVRGPPRRHPGKHRAAPDLHISEAIRVAPLALVAQHVRDVLTDFRQDQLLADAQLQQLTIDRSEERSEEHTSELQSQSNLVCRLLLEKKKKKKTHNQQDNTL